MRRDDALIDDICDAGMAAISYVENMTEEAFYLDRRTQKAVISEILVMGEAVKRLSSQYRENHPEFPWSQIAGMRDKLIHDYNKIDLNILWETTQSSIPEAVELLKPLLPPETA